MLTPLARWVARRLPANQWRGTSEKSKRSLRGVIAWRDMPLAWVAIDLRSIGLLHVRSIAGVNWRGPMRSRVRRATRRAPLRRTRIRLGNDARRAQLLELGMKVFAESTYDDVSIDDLARAAGISKGLLYHYFPTKRDLYLAGLRHVAGELLERTDVSKLPLAPIERIRVGIDNYLTFVSERANSYIALMRGGIGSDPEVLRIVEASREALVRSEEH